MKLIISAGHDPKFPGTTNEVARVREIANELKKYVSFEQIPDGLGGSSGNDNLIRKINWANARSLASDIYISIHVNCCGGKGSEVWFYGGSAESEKKGKKFAEFMAQETGRPNRGAKPDTSARYGRLGEVRDTKAWAWLVECGFTDNPEDMSLPADKYARGIAKYIEWLGIPVNWNQTPVEDPKDARIRELESQLKTCNERPPTEVIKEVIVEKIVEKPVIQIVEKEKIVLREPTIGEIFQMIWDKIKNIKIKE